jgi:hypothetical protein
MIWCRGGSQDRTGVPGTPEVVVAAAVVGVEVGVEVDLGLPLRTCLCLLGLGEVWGAPCSQVYGVLTMMLPRPWSRGGS